MCGSQNRRYSDDAFAPRFLRVLPFRTLPAGLVEQEPMNLIAPDKAARMASIKNSKSSSSGDPVKK
jgi:hypothetical protein